MNKRIYIFFCFFIGILVISLIWILLLRFDYYTKAILFNFKNETYILLNEKDYWSLNNNQKIKVLLNQQNIEYKIINNYFVDQYCFVMVDYINLQESITNISVYLKSKNLFGF